MAGIGMYGVFYAKAVIQNGIVTGYTGGTKTMGKAISASFEPNTPDDNPLYANNGEAENDNSSASGGTLTLKLDRLTKEAAADMYNLQVVKVTTTVNGQQVTGEGLRYTGMEQSSPLGTAFIRMLQEDGVRKHEVLLYRRATYSMPTEAAQTLGESIEWQTPEITGSVMGMEGDRTNAWYETFVFPTQAAAIAYIESVFGLLASKSTSIVGEGAAGYATVGDAA